MSEAVLLVSFKNENTKPLIVYVEMAPERYVLKRGETLEIFGQPSEHRPSFIWHDEGLTIYPEIYEGEKHRIDGVDAASRSWSE